MRTKAENLVARAVGVKKVVDEMALGDTPAPTDQASTSDQNTSQPPNCELQSDGTCAPAAQPSQQAENTPPPIPNQGSAAIIAQQQQPSASPQKSPQGNQYPGGYGPPQAQTQPQPYGRTRATSSIPAATVHRRRKLSHSPTEHREPAISRRLRPSSGPVAITGLPQLSHSPTASPPMANRSSRIRDSPSPTVRRSAVRSTATVRNRLTLRRAVNRPVSRSRSLPDPCFASASTAAWTPTTFSRARPLTARSSTTSPADGAVAIPRGAPVQGTVIDARKAGALSGQGELSLEIDSVTLAGVNYPLRTQLWEQQGRDKTASTVNSAIGLGALGAIIGGIAGGGAGAAVGAAAGAGVGIAGSASSPGGRVVVPPEAVICLPTRAAGRRKNRLRAGDGTARLRCRPQPAAAADAPLLQPVLRLLLRALLRPLMPQSSSPQGLRIPQPFSLQRA